VRSWNRRGRVRNIAAVPAGKRTDVGSKLGQAFLFSFFLVFVAGIWQQRFFFFVFRFIDFKIVAICLCILAADTTITS